MGRNTGAVGLKVITDVAADEEADETRNVKKRVPHRTHLPRHLELAADDGAEAALRADHKQKRHCQQQHGTKQGVIIHWHEDKDEIQHRTGAAEQD